jgi:Zn-finger nucleic acid-binding protein
MKCPNCKDVSLVMADRSGIEIDYCPECRGVWLDRGELDKIIERSLPQQEKRTPEDNYQGKNYSDRDNDYRYKKKKGLLGDLFDF